MDKHSLDYLVLIPTRFELNRLKEFLPSGFWENRVDAADDLKFGVRLQTEICGCGLVVAGVQAMKLICQLKPRQVVLLGIAGSLDGETELGRAYLFDEVCCDGIGAGSGSEFISLQQMGWLQWEGDSHSQPIGCCLDLRNPLCNAVDDSPTRPRRGLLSVAAASLHKDQAAQRMQAFSTAQAEDMEGFSVAVACHLTQTPLSIVRGISNVAGDRSKANWKTRRALESAAELMLKVIKTI
jgi:futalosine hydrolase